MRFRLCWWDSEEPYGLLIGNYKYTFHFGRVFNEIPPIWSFTIRLWPPYLSIYLGRPFMVFDRWED